MNFKCKLTESLILSDKMYVDLRKVPEVANEMKLPKLDIFSWTMQG